MIQTLILPLPLSTTHFKPDLPATQGHVHRHLKHCFPNPDTAIHTCRRLCPHATTKCNFATLKCWESGCSSQPALRHSLLPPLWHCSRSLCERTISKNKPSRIHRTVDERELCQGEICGSAQWCVCRPYRLR